MTKHSKPIDHHRVMDLNRRGFSNREIANSMGIPIRSVRHVVVKHGARIASPIHSANCPTPPITAREYSQIRDSDERLHLRMQAICDDATRALIAVYGQNCFARHEFRICSDGPKPVASPNPFVHTPALP